MRGAAFKVIMWFALIFLVSAATALPADKISVFVSIPPQKYHVEKIGGEKVAVSVMADPLASDWADNIRRQATIFQSVFTEE